MRINLNNGIMNTSPGPDPQEPGQGQGPDPQGPGQG